MIAKLTGILDSVGDDWAILDVGGVGYLVFCSSRTLAQLPGTGEAVSVVIETHIREDHIHLYGFLDHAERDWFKLLSKFIVIWDFNFLELTLKNKTMDMKLTL